MSSLTLLTVPQLLELCRSRGIKGYSGKKKSEIIQMLSVRTVRTVRTVNSNDILAKTPSEKKESLSSGKKNRGQFYTTNADYILEGLPITKMLASQKIIEPFAGKGDLIEWLNNHGYSGEISAYDIDPKYEGVECRDTLKGPPDYSNSWVITNPPYLARNKSTSKEIYDLYDTNDLYKCFIFSLLGKERTGCPLGGILIIPAGFFFSSRALDVRCRGEFMKTYKLIYVKYFEETVFQDTTTTVVAIAFEKRDEGGKEFTEQHVEWEILPSKVKKTFLMSSRFDWIIGGEIYHLPLLKSVSIRRHVEGRPLSLGEQQTFITLNALDSGKWDREDRKDFDETSKSGRIGLSFKKGYVYQAKECSRTYATLRITGKELSEEEQISLCHKFNKFLEEKRKETWSLFLPQFRESKEYARKRIPFELAYSIILHLLL